MCVGSCTFAILLCFTLSALILHTHTHTFWNSLMCIHVKAIDFSFSSFLTGSIPVQDNACEHTAENQGTSPLMSFFSWVSQEKKTLIGYSCWEHGRASAPRLSLECAITFNSSNCLLIKSCFTDQHRVLAYKWFVYNPLCSFSIYWWYAVVYECNY